MSTTDVDPMRCQVTVPLGREAAFELLTAGIAEWMRGCR